MQDGWGRGTPDRDTIVRAKVLAMADRCEAVTRSVGREPYRDDDVVAGDLGVDAPFVNQVVLLHPGVDAGAVSERVAEAIPPGHRATIFTPFSLPGLAEHGWTLGGHPPFMVRGVGGDVPPVPDGLRIEEALDAEAVATFERVLIEGFPVAELQPVQPGVCFGPSLAGSATHCFTAWLGDEAVATAAGHVAYGINLVEFVATMGGHRGRGFGAAVTWAATLADPTLPAVLVASDDGRPVYERMGYLAVDRWNVWLRA
jgi:hypothetical protein